MYTIEALTRDVVNRQAADRGIAELAENEYPGRLDAVGINASGTQLHIVGATMGRRPSSQDRTYESEEDGIRTVPLDPEADVDPLTLYRALAQYENWHIATNGDQTDTIVEALGEAFDDSYWGPLDTFKVALLGRNHEPDPSRTARISAMVGVDSSRLRDCPTGLSIIRFHPHDPDNKEASFHRFYVGTLRGLLLEGTGLYVHTYEQNDDPLEPFEGGPRIVAMGETPQATAELFAETLDRTGGFLVSAFARAVDLRTGEVSEPVILNKYGQKANFPIPS